MNRTRLRIAAALLPMAVAVAACDDGNDGVRCSFDNPAVIDTAPDKWPKFRRDLQNTGTVALAAAGYAQVAAGDPQAPATHAARWTFPPADSAADAAFVGSPSLSPNGDVVYLGGTNGRILGLRADGDDAGTPIRVETESDSRDFLISSEPFAITTTPMVATRDGIDAVFVGAANARIYGVGSDGVSLDDIWPGILDTGAGSSPAMLSDGTVLVGTLGAGVYATCPNGVTRYISTTGSSLSSPAVGRLAGVSDEDEDELFVVGGDDGLLRAIREDGILQWSFAFAAPIMAAPVVLLDAATPATIQAVFAVDSTGAVQRLTADGRRAPGFFPPASLGPVLASPALAPHPAGDLRLYVIGFDGSVHAIDADSGDLLWTWPAGVAVESSPAVVVDAAGENAPVLVFGTWGGELLYLRDAGDGAELIGRFAAAGGAPVTTSPAVGSDGSVYAASLDGRVYAVR